MVELARVRRRYRRAVAIDVVLVCARPVIARVGWSFAAIALVVLVTAVLPGLPPVAAAALTGTGDRVIGPRGTVR